METGFRADWEIYDLVRGSNQGGHCESEPFTAYDISIDCVMLTITIVIGPGMFQPWEYQHMKVSVLTPDKILRDFDFSISHKFLRFLI